MKEFISKNKTLILVSIIVGVIIIPVLINSIFKLQAPCDFLSAEWTAGEFLSFYGAILASLATIVGVYLSIQYAQRNYREDELNKVRPYLALSHYNTIRKTSLFPLSGQLNRNEESPSDTDYYEEYRLDKVYISIESDGIKYNKTLSQKQKDVVETGGMSWARGDGICRTLEPDFYISMPLEVENVGFGAATATKIGFYRKGSNPTGVNIYTLRVGESIYCHIYSDIDKYELLGDYILEFTYNSILGNSYSQKYNVKVFEEKESGKFGYSIDLDGQQTIKLEDKQNG